MHTTHTTKIQFGLEAGRPRTLRYLPGAGPRQVVEALAALTPEWDLARLLIVHEDLGAPLAVERASNYRDQVAAFNR